MRILTVRQPWAWAIIHGGKDVENRTRNLAGDYRGPVAIHAGLAPAPLRSPETHRDIRVANVLAEASIADLRKTYRFGAILGIVDLVEVHRVVMTDHRPHCETVDEPSDPRVSGACSSWADIDLHHLVLENPRALPTPIPYRGALCMQHAPADLEARIMAGLA